MSLTSRSAGSLTLPVSFMLGIKGMTWMIEDRKTNFPAEIKVSYLSHEGTALRCAEKADYSGAEREYRALLSVIMEAQGEAIRYHKGGPYHQIGYYLFLQGKNDDARTYFLYAFIEDCITLDNFPELPAFKNLYGVYQASYEDLRALFYRVKDDYHKTIPLNPEDYLRIYLDSGKSIESVSVRRETKVFVGGNYRNIAILRHIEKTVREFGLSPILASNFEARESEIYLHSMRLLQDCGSAIFEITFDAGHLMEIERAINLNDKKNILLLYQQLERDEKHYTRMLWGVEVGQVGYMHIDELVEHVKEFLKVIKVAFI